MTSHQNAIEYATDQMQQRNISNLSLHLTLVATTQDGMNNREEVVVNYINTWINRRVEHKVNVRSIKSLLKDALNSGMMTINDNGGIDGFGEPLYTNGQRYVCSLHLNGVKIWK